MLRSRARILIMAALAVATVAALLTAAPQVHARHRATTQVAIGSYNIFAHVSADVLNDAMRAVLPRVDILGVQEAQGKKKDWPFARLAGEGWGVYRPDRGQNPVLWRRSRFVKLSARTVRLSRARYVGDEWPGPQGTLKENRATVVRLRDRQSGQRVSVVNVHLAPGAVSAGLPIPGRPKLFQLFTQQVRRLGSVARLEGRWGRVFVLGDLNSAWGADAKRRHRRLPFTAFRRVGMTACWATEHPPLGRGTRGTALLDTVYAETRARSARVAFEVTYSDHFPVLTTYKLPAR